MADGNMANIPSRDFVVFNVPQDCSVETIKSYIYYNGAHVLDIRRLSKEEWHNQSFCVTVLHVNNTLYLIRNSGQRVLGIDVSSKRG